MLLLLPFSSLNVPIWPLLPSMSGGLANLLQSKNHLKNIFWKHLIVLFWCRQEIQKQRLKVSITLNFFNFEKYFKIPYDPFHMERTFREASEALKEKYQQVLEKFNAKPKQTSLLKLPQTEPPYQKFSPVPNTPFGLAKPIPGPFLLKSIQFINTLLGTIRLPMFLLPNLAITSLLDSKRK